MNNLDESMSPCGQGRAHPKKPLCVEPCAIQIDEIDIDTHLELVADTNVHQPPVYTDPLRVSQHLDIALDLPRVENVPLIQNNVKKIVYLIHELVCVLTIVL